MARMYTKSVLVAEETHENLKRLKLTDQEPFGLVVERLVAFYNQHKNDNRESSLAYTEKLSYAGSHLER